MTTETKTTIRISGDDAREFLQGQLTNDVNRLDKNDAMLSAWCTPKGRVISVFDVARDGADYTIGIPTELADTVIARLTMYRFRSRVDFAEGDSREPVDLAGQIAAGLPWVGKRQSEQFTPHMLNLDLLDAISMDKGCYTGQEIVARTHYKGATKRRTFRYQSELPVSVGDKVSDGTRDIGEVLNVAGNELLAVIPVAKSNETLSVNGTRIDNRPLPYLQS